MLPPTLLFSIVVINCIICIVDSKEFSSGKAIAPSRCWTNGNGVQAKWWSEGEIVERGKYWYKCQNGKMVPQGCIDYEGSRLELEEAITENGYVLQCMLEKGHPTFKHVGCAVDERVFEIGDSWTEGKYWYECVKAGHVTRIRLAGCLSHDEKTKLRIGEKMDHGNYSYECQQKANGALQLCPVGCIYNGRHFKIGEQWQEGNFLYYCKRDGGKCQKTCVGCVFQGRNLFNGDRFRRDSSVLECQVRSKRHTIKPVACVDHRGVERVVGCIWHDKIGPTHVLHTCRSVDGGAVVEALGCIYMNNGYRIMTIRPNRYALWKKRVEDKEPLGISCLLEKTGLVVKTFPAGGNITRATAGLRFEFEPHS